MKLITDRNMLPILSIVASSEAVGFPATNLQQYDPGLIWKCNPLDWYIVQMKSMLNEDAAITITIDLAEASSIRHIWLNNANFLIATIEANPTNEWSTPAFSKSATLAADDIGVVKGFFDLTETDYRYVRVRIPGQALIDGAAPFLGNLILGASEYLHASSWEPTVAQEFNSFLSDGGSYSEEAKGKGRHIFATSMTSEPKASIDTAPLNNWSVAVIFTDMGSVGDSYLVYAPKGKKMQVRSPIDADLSYVLNELV